MSEVIYKSIFHVEKNPNELKNSILSNRTVFHGNLKKGKNIPSKKKLRFKKLKSIDTKNAVKIGLTSLELKEEINDSLEKKQISSSPTKKLLDKNYFKEKKIINQLKEQRKSISEKNPSKKTKIVDRGRKIINIFKCSTVLKSDFSIGNKKESDNIHINKDLSLPQINPTKQIGKELDFDNFKEKNLVDKKSIFKIEKRDKEYKEEILLNIEGKPEEKIELVTLTKETVNESVENLLHYRGSISKDKKNSLKDEDLILQILEANSKSHNISRRFTGKKNNNVDSKSNYNETSENFKCNGNQLNSDKSNKEKVTKFSSTFTKTAETSENDSKLKDKKTNPNNQDESCYNIQTIYLQNSQLYYPGKCVLIMSDFFDRIKNADKVSHFFNK